MSFARHSPDCECGHPECSRQELRLMDDYLKYNVDMDIRNLAELPTGTGCRWLVCIRGEGDALVAKRWSRRKPALQLGEVAVEFV